MLDVTSTAFQAGEPIPRKYTCDGSGLSPPLSWSKVPDNTQSVAVMVDDPDSPNGPFLHWLVTDLPPTVRRLDEGAELPPAARIGETDGGSGNYYGPCPSAGRHHYRFHVYALDAILGLRPADRDAFLSAIAGHVLDEGELIATYQRVHR